MDRKPRLFHACSIRWAGEPCSSNSDDERIDRVQAELIDLEVTAMDIVDGAARFFFSTASLRDRAVDLARVIAPTAEVSPIDVSDENWAERSQASVTAVDLGGIVVAPPWDVPANRPGTIVIQPSMGFGTAHHESTRLCLRLLQQRDVTGLRVFDAGTGSGVLAIAARLRGARDVLAADYDADAIASARENVELNDLAGQVALMVLDLGTPHELRDREFDLVFANLTGGLLTRFAPTLARLIPRDGTMITSGFTTEEEAGVTSAMNDAGLSLDARLQEGDWIGAAWRRT